MQRLQRNHAAGCHPFRGFGLIQSSRAMLPSGFPSCAFDLFADPWSFENPQNPKIPQKQKIAEVRWFLFGGLFCMVVENSSQTQHTHTHTKRKAGVLGTTPSWRMVSWRLWPDVRWGCSLASIRETECEPPKMPSSDRQDDDDDDDDDDGDDGDDDDDGDDYSRIRFWVNLLLMGLVWSCSIFPMLCWQFSQFLFESNILCGDGNIWCKLGVFSLRSLTSRATLQPSSLKYRFFLSLG